MPPNKVRADYDSLRQIAKHFGQEAEATHKSLRNLQQVVDTLRRGDWIGEGANKFYHEFDSAVLPSLKRLQGALETAARTATEIENVMQQAEELVAKLFAASGEGASSIGGGRRAGAAASANGTSAQQSPAQATEARLNASGVTIQSSGNCRDRGNASCTSLEGIREQTVDGLIAFRNSVGMDLVVTGGTEVGHSAGQYSHANGYKVDIGLDPTVNQYIQDHYEHTGQRSDGAELYRDANGNVFARESNHWDITFY